MTLTNFIIFLCTNVGKINSLCCKISIVLYSDRHRQSLVRSNIAVLKIHRLDLQIHSFFYCLFVQVRIFGGAIFIIFCSVVGKYQLAFLIKGS